MNPLLWFVLPAVLYSSVLFHAWKRAQDGMFPGTEGDDEAKTLKLRKEYVEEQTLALLTRLGEQDSQIKNLTSYPMLYKDALETRDLFARQYLEAVKVAEQEFDKTYRRGGL